MLVLAVAVAAVVTLLVLGRPGGDDPEPGAQTDPWPAAPAPPGVGQPPAGDPPPAHPAPSAVPPTSDPPATPAAPVPSVLPHDESGVTGDETLSSEQAAAALAVADEFAQRWAQPHPDWYTRVAELAAPALAASLADADPPQPTPALIGPGQLLFDTPEWARVGVPAERGTLVLDLVVVGDDWRVAAVDWWSA